MLKKILKYLFPKIFKEQELTIEYLIRQRSEILSQVEILMEREWSFYSPTYEETVRILNLYKAKYDKEFNRMYLRTGTMSVLYPFFIDLPEQSHYLELDVNKKRLYLNGDILVDFHDKDILKQKEDKEEPKIH